MMGAEFHVSSHSSSTAYPPSAHEADRLPVNDLARSYQPRRVWGASISIAWNLLLAGVFVGSRAAYELMIALGPANHGRSILYLCVLFAGYAALNFPLELWLGYLQERAFGLAKDGIRAWARDWFVGTVQHGVMFVIGAAVILFCQRLAGEWWLVIVSAALLGLFVGTTYFTADLIPKGLFNVERADEVIAGRLRSLLPSGVPPLPAVRIYTHPTLREYAGGIAGLGGRQVYLISRSTLESAGDGLLRFVLLHDLGHRRYHHNLLATLAGWAWVVIGLAVSHACIPRWMAGTPLYVAWLALLLSLWMAIGQPVLAYFGRRLEYQADRFYLRHGGTLEEMRAALSELAQRNLARTERLRRRQTIFHPLPTVTNRIYAATRVVGESQE
jgi:Zn-dependent protease with chaperone function